METNTSARYSALDMASVCAAAIVAHEAAKLAGTYVHHPASKVLAMGAVYLGTAAAVYHLANDTKASPYHRQ